MVGQCSMFMTPFSRKTCTAAWRGYPEAPSQSTRLLHRIMDQEDRRAPRAPIRAARQLHTRGGPSTPGYMNWDGTDGVWRNDRGETQEEGRARQAQKEEAARALCKPAQHSAPARQQHHHPMCPLLVHRINAFPQYSHGLCVRSSSCSHRGHLRPCVTPMSAWLARRL